MAQQSANACKELAEARTAFSRSVALEFVRDVPIIR
jgi:hypothetical protein